MTFQQFIEDLCRAGKLDGMRPTAQLVKLPREWQCPVCLRVLPPGVEAWIVPNKGFSYCQHCGPVDKA